MPKGKGTYGSKRGRPPEPKKKNNSGDNNTSGAISSRGVPNTKLIEHNLKNYGTDADEKWELTKTMRPVPGPWEATMRPMPKLSPEEIKKRKRTAVITKAAGRGRTRREEREGR